MSSTSSSSSSPPPCSICHACAFVQTCKPTCTYQFEKCRAPGTATSTERHATGHRHAHARAQRHGTFHKPQTSNRAPHGGAVARCRQRTPQCCTAMHAEAQCTSSQSAHESNIHADLKACTASTQRACEGRSRKCTRTPYAHTTRMHTRAHKPPQSRTHTNACSEWWRKAAHRANTNVHTQRGAVPQDAA